MKTAVCVFAKPVGGICGTTRVFPDILQTAAKVLKKAEGEIILDSFVTHTADRLVLIMTHEPEILPNPLADAAFFSAGEIAQKRHLFCDTAPASFCQMTISERENESLLLFLAGSEMIPWGDILTPNENQITNGVLCLARAGGRLPSTAEFCERFARRSLNLQGVSPVSLCDSSNVRTTVIPVAGLGFSLWEGQLTGPADLFDTPLFDAPRFWASNRGAELSDQKIHSYLE